MSSPVADSRGASRITHGAVLVLAYLHERDASFNEVARETILSKSSVYRWLTELADAGIIEAEATHLDGRAVTVYRLDDDELGAAAQVIADRLGGDRIP